MSKKAFSTALVALGLLGAAAMVFLYMTLGHLQASVAARGGEKPSPPAAADANGEQTAQQQLAAQGYKEMTLTPAGEAQMRLLEAGQGQPPASPAAPGASAPSASRPASPGASKVAAPGPSPAAERSAKPNPAVATGAH